MEPFPDRDRTPDPDALADRVQGLVSWIQDLDTRVRATEVATGDEKTAKELRKAVEALAKHDPKFEERLTNKVDVLADRVATLAGTVSTTTAALAGKDGELAGLRRELATIAEAVAELQTEARRVSGPAELDELRRAVERLASERQAKGESKKIAGLEEKLALLGQRIDTVSSTVSTATSGLAGAEGEVLALRRRLDEEGAQLEATVAELHAAVDPVPLHQLRAGLESVSGHVSTLQQETRRDLVAMGVHVENATHRLAALEATVATALDSASETSSGLALLRSRIQAAEEHGTSLERMTATVHTGLSELRQEVGEVAAMARSETDSLRGRMEAGDERATLLDQALAGLGVQLASLAEQVDTAASRTRAAELEVGSELTSLTARFEAGCAQVDALVDDLRASLETMPAPVPGLDASLLERVEALGGRLDALADDVSRAALAGEAEGVSGLVEDLARRVAIAERELSELGRSQEPDVRLDELVHRIEGVETSLRAASALPPVAGDGRFRVEIRALELRLEHAEATAREGREAVLTEIERLAAEIEARLQQLETVEPDPAFAEPDTEGRVVPLRSSEA